MKELGECAKEGREGSFMAALGQLQRISPDNQEGNSPGGQNASSKRRSDRRSAEPGVPGGKAG